MYTRGRLASATIIVAMLCSASAQAEEYSRKMLGEWMDPFTLPHTRTSCIREFKTKSPFSKKWWKTCSEWKTQSSHIEVVADLITTGPNDIRKEARDLVNKCVSAASAAAFGTGFLTSAAGVPLAFGAAKVAFSACMVAGGSDLLNGYDVRIETRSHWTDWS